MSITIKETETPGTYIISKDNQQVVFTLEIRERNGIYLYRVLLRDHYSNIEIEFGPHTGSVLYFYLSKELPPNPKLKGIGKYLLAFCIKHYFEDNSTTIPDNYIIDLRAEGYHFKNSNPVFNFSFGTGEISPSLKISEENKKLIQKEKKRKEKNRKKDQDL